MKLRVSDCQAAITGRFNQLNAGQTHPEQFGSDGTSSDRHRNRQFLTILRQSVPADNDYSTRFSRTRNGMPNPAETRDEDAGRRGSTAETAAPHDRVLDRPDRTAIPFLNVNALTRKQYPDRETRDAGSVPGSARHSRMPIADDMKCHSGPRQTSPLTETENASFCTKISSNAPLYRPPATHEPCLMDRRQTLFATNGIGPGSGGACA